MVTGPVFLDTSVFLGGIIETGAGAQAAPRLMDALAEGRLGRALTAWHCCLEFYSVATRLPAPLRVPPAEARRLVEEEIAGRCEVIDLPRGERLPFLRTAAREGIAGGRLHDAHIAEVARLGGARVVLTENRRHFVALLRHGVRVLTSQEFLAEARP